MTTFIHHKLLNTQKYTRTVRVYVDKTLLYPHGAGENIEHMFCFVIIIKLKNSK